MPQGKNTTIDWMTKTVQLVFFCFLPAFIFAQGGDTTKQNNQGVDRFILTVEQSLNAFYAEHANQSNYDSIISALNYESKEIPSFSDAVYCERLLAMSNKSPFRLDCTPASLSTIKFFAAKRRSFARVVLGRSALYFEMFEEKLAQYGLPLELKYLAVIESGLRPQVKSHAGALGLWQFMYRTGLYYGLEENSYIDQRMDPELATDAACRYLKKLFDIYGDWNLALASYNAGPGNVNKAIRRSGGKTTYWEVRPFLPKETQGYVPNFIAAAYLLTYHAEHNIIPMEAKWNYAQLDTICLNSGFHLSTISKLTGWELEEIKALNPIYKTGYVPRTTPGQCLTGPLQEIGNLVSREKELEELEIALFSPQKIEKESVETVVSDTLAQESESILVVSGVPKPQPVAVITYKYHTVRRGEGLGVIASKYNITVNELMTTNDMKSTVLYAGQKLKIPVPVLSETDATETVTKDVETAPTVVVPKPKPIPAKKYYNVRAGDTGSKICKKNNLTQQQLIRLNPGLNINRITVGQQLRVK